MRNGTLGVYFVTAPDAVRAGREKFDDDLFSVQEVTDRAADFGWYSRAPNHEQFCPRVGPLVEAIVSEPFDLASEENLPRREKVAMLVDTGASDSSISGRVADRLGLQVLGLHTVVGFGSTGDALQHLADIELLLDEAFPISNPRLFRFDKDTDRFQGILGRDVLGRGTLWLSIAS